MNEYKRQQEYGEKLLELNEMLRLDLLELDLRKKEVYEKFYSDVENLREEYKDLAEPKKVVE